MNKLLNLGTPVLADVSTIERELALYWQSAAVLEGEKASIRACSCNLLAVAQDLNEAMALPYLLASASEVHPCRSIIACPEQDSTDAKSSDSSMNAWLRLQCHAPFSGSPQVCCELITVAAQRSSYNDLANVLVSLFIPDLPVFVYWPSLHIFGESLIDGLSKFIQVLILDSNAADNSPNFSHSLGKLLARLPANIAIRDINWSRITAWRDLISQFFDSPSSRADAYQISEVSICRRTSSTDAPTMQPLLLTGWLAARLGWVKISAEQDNSQWMSGWRSSSGEVRVRFTTNSASRNQPPGIGSITLKTRSGKAYEVVDESNKSCLTSREHDSGIRVVHSVPRQSLDESNLLIEELSMVGPDRGYKEALNQALSLANSFRKPSESTP